MHISDVLFQNVASPPPPKKYANATGSDIISNHALYSASGSFNFLHVFEQNFPILHAKQELGTRPPKYALNTKQDQTCKVLHSMSPHPNRPSTVFCPFEYKEFYGQSFTAVLSTLMQIKSSFPPRMLSLQILFVFIVTAVNFTRSLVYACL